MVDACVRLFKKRVLLSQQAEWLAIGIQETIYRAYGDATRLVKVAYALIAFVGVNFIDVIAFGYCPDRAFRLAKTAIDAIIGN